VGPRRYTLGKDPQPWYGRIVRRHRGVELIKREKKSGRILLKPKGREERKAGWGCRGNEEGTGRCESAI